MYPRLVVFDFHKTLSLDKKDLNTLLNPYKAEFRKINNTKAPLTDDFYYNLFTHYKIELDQIIPKWDQLRYFINFFQQNSPNTIMGIASMIENEALILGMMKYAFERMELPNPFNEDTVVGTYTVYKYGREPVLSGKKRHILTITTNLGLENDIRIGDTVLIDDTLKVIDATAPICGVLASDYFQISDWNRAQGSGQCVWSPII